MAAYKANTAATAPKMTVDTTGRSEAAPPVYEAGMLPEGIGAPEAGVLLVEFIMVPLEEGAEPEAEPEAAAGSTTGSYDEQVALVGAIGQSSSMQMACSSAGAEAGIDAGGAQR